MSFQNDDNNVKASNQQSSQTFQKKCNHHDLQVAIKKQGFPG